MEIKLNHSFDKDILMQRIKTVFEQLKQEHSDVQILEEQWQDYSGTFAAKASGIKIKGSLEVRNEQVIVKADIPLIIKPFESQIRQIFVEEFTNRILSE